jgi:hypothetical protein
LSPPRSDISWLTMSHPTMHPMASSVATTIR